MKVKKELSALELSYLARELQQIVNAKIDRIYLLKDNNLLFQLHIPNKGREFLFINKHFLFLTDTKKDVIEPNSFVMFLRKQLGNSFIARIEQLKPERILLIEVKKKDKMFRIYIELFARTNFIVTDKEDVILAARSYEKFKERTIRARAKYIYPRKDINFFEIDKEKLASILKESNKESIVKFLALDLGLGGLFAEELCLNARVDKKKKLIEIKSEDVGRIIKELRKLLNKEIEAFIVKSNGKIIDAIPFKLNIYSNLKLEKEESFSKAIKEFYLVNFEKYDEVREEIRKFERIIAKQKEIIKQLEKDIIENKLKAEKIYENYDLIKEILEGDLNKKEIVEINKKEKYVIVDL